MVSESANKPARFSVLRIALAFLLGLIGLLLAISVWLINTQSGARAAFSALDSLTGGAVRAEGIHGHLASPVRFDRLWLQTADQRVEMNDVRVDWNLSGLLQRRLHVRQLRIAHVSVDQKIKEDDDQPMRMPENIRLPFMLQVDKAQIDSGLIRRGPTDLITIGGLAFSLTFDDSHYRLGLDRLTLRPGDRPASAVVDLNGQATLSATKPYAVDARIASAAEATVQDRTFSTSGNIGLGGSLAELVASADLAFQQARLDAKAVLRPFSEQPLGNARINMRALDLSAINPTWPHTVLNLGLSADQDGAGELELTNAAPGLYNNARVPLTELRIAFHQQDGDFIFDKISSVLGTPGRPAGSFNGSGRYADSGLTLALRTSGLDLQRLDQRFPATRLTGKTEASHTGNRQELSVDLREPLKKKPLSLSAHATLTDARLTVDRAALQVGSGRADLTGHVGLSESKNFAAQGRISKFRLQDLGDFPQLPRMTLNGTFELSGERSPQLAADLTFKVTESQVAGNPLRGEGRARLRGEQIIVPNLLLVAGVNRLTLQGELSERDSELKFMLQAPRLGQLGAGFGGAIAASGTARGTIARPRIDLDWKADGVRLPDNIRIAQAQGSARIDIDRTKPFFINTASIDASARGLKNDTRQLASLSAKIRFAPQPDAPFTLDLHATGIAIGEFRADRFDATADGTTARHVLDARLTEPGQNWSVKASGGLAKLAQAPQWQGQIDRVDGTGRIDAKLQTPAPFAVSRQRMQLDRFQLDADTAVIAIEQFVRDADGIATRGRIERLHVGKLLKFAGPSPAISTDLQIEGDWNLTLADTINGTLHLRRTGGDVEIRGGVPIILGLSALQASANASNGRLHLALTARGQQLGQIELDASTSLAGGFSISPDAPLSGRARIDIPTIAWAGPMISPTLVTGGRIQSNIAVGGTLSEPRLTGRIAGNDLRFHSADLGVDLRQGVLESEFQDADLLVKSLQFQNADGRLTIAGPISFAGGKPAAQLALTAERFMLLNQSDRRLTISGQSRIALVEKRASVTGDFTVDSGYFDIGRAGTPQLSDDVVIVGRTEQSRGGVVPAINIRIGLGNGVRLEGRGIDAVLVGEIRLQNAPGEQLQAYGSLRIDKGTYAAYGRELAIEQGALRFTGPINNPALNILALRRGQEVEAGVSVQGTVLAPRITLVSEPPVPEAEKLSWLVLGRGLSGVGESELGSLQSAAAALLSQSAAAGVTSQIANAFGLDTVSLSQSDDSLQQRIVTLGKQISRRLYVSYQQGLEAANSAVLLRYTLSPRFSVEVTAGTRSAFSLFYNITFD